MISTARIHLYLALLLHRDYFVPVKCISIWLFCSTEMISTARIHLYLALLPHRDYFGRLDSSLSGSFVPQRLFQPHGFISIWLCCSTGIILPRSNASLSGFSGIQLACKFYFPHSFRTNSRQSSRRRPIDRRPLTPPCVPFGTRRFNQFNK